MIRKIHGLLESLDEHAAFIALADGLTYEVLLSAYTSARLGGSIGQPVTLHTVHYLESASQGANFTPRLAGFASPTDRSFFELLKSVNRIGPRKALRAMALATHQIAAAIADRDIQLLQSLPEVGKRTAETIVATLHGKVNRFLHATTPSGGGSTAGAVTSTGSDESGEDQPAASRSIAREAMEVLIQLGETRLTAMALIDQTLTAEPGIEDSRRLITEALRRRAGT